MSDLREVILDVATVIIFCLAALAAGAAIVALAWGLAVAGVG